MSCKAAQPEQRVGLCCRSPRRAAPRSSASRSAGTAVNVPVDVVNVWPIVGAGHERVGVGHAAAGVELEPVVRFGLGRGAAGRSPGRTICVPAGM